MEQRGFLGGVQEGVEELGGTVHGAHVYLYVGPWMSAYLSVSLRISEREGVWWRGAPSSRKLEGECASPHDCYLLFLNSNPLLPPLECPLPRASQGCFLLVTWVSAQV